MIIDCCTSSRELHELPRRLEELSGIVDWFVLVERSQPMSSGKMEAPFETRLEEFKDYPICCVNIPTTQESPSQNSLSLWHQALLHALRQIHPGMGDMVIHSGVEEIPRGECVIACARALQQESAAWVATDASLVLETWLYDRLATGGGLPGVVRYGGILAYDELRRRAGMQVLEPRWKVCWTEAARRRLEKRRAGVASDPPESLDPAQVDRCVEAVRALFTRTAKMGMLPQSPSKRSRLATSDLAWSCDGNHYPQMEMSWDGLHWREDAWWMKL